MAKARFIVKDCSTYASPVGGRMASYRIVDTALGIPLLRSYDTRTEARTVCRGANRLGPAERIAFRSGRLSPILSQPV